MSVKVETRYRVTLPRDERRDLVVDLGTEDARVLFESLREVLEPVPLLEAVLHSFPAVLPVAIPPLAIDEGAFLREETSARTVLRDRPEISEDVPQEAALAPPPAGEYVTGEFSDDEKDQLRRWLREDLILKEMAARLNRKEASVRYKVDQLRKDDSAPSPVPAAPAIPAIGLPTNGWTPTLDRLLRRLMADGENFIGAARYLRKPVHEIEAHWADLHRTEKLTEEASDAAE